MSGNFQVCGSCRRTWATCEKFVVDPGVRLLGLQSHAGYTDINLLVFEHACGSSISVLARRLRHLLPPAPPGAPIVRLLNTSECRGHCLRLRDLQACDRPCANERDRELMLLLLRMKKEARRLARY